MGGKFYQKLEVFIPRILLNINFLKRNGIISVLLGKFLGLNIFQTAFGTVPTFTVAQYN
jgi:hypothetical protein